MKRKQQTKKEKTKEPRARDTIMNKSHVIAMSTGLSTQWATQTLKSGPSSKESLKIVVIPSEVREWGLKSDGTVKEGLFEKCYFCQEL